MMCANYPNTAIHANRNLKGQGFAKSFQYRTCWFTKQPATIIPIPCTTDLSVMSYIAVVCLKVGVTAISTSTDFSISLLHDICWYFHIFKTTC
jgi:hypothetical protein